MDHSHAGVTVLAILAALFVVWTVWRINRRERRRRERERWIDSQMGNVKRGKRW